MSIILKTLLLSLSLSLKLRSIDSFCFIKSVEILLISFKLWQDNSKEFDFSAFIFCSFFSDFSELIFSSKLYSLLSKYFYLFYLNLLHFMKFMLFGLKLLFLLVQNILIIFCLLGLWQIIFFSSISFSNSSSRIFCITCF